jgi:TonB-dependent starch-binding outer membrane protein SusC
MPSKLTMLRSWLTPCRVARHALLLLFTFCSLSVFAQTRVTGKVTSTTTNQPVSGASVQVEGTSVGVVTGDDGSFSVNVPAGRNTLVISFIGFKQVVVPINNRTDISVTLEEDASGLSEVVVTGYSSQQRRNIVGAVSTVKGEQLAAVPSGNPEQQLQGRAPGVTVITSGQPGSVSQVRIRGFGSFSGNEPLYVVDGVPTFNIDFLNANDIDNTTVLKDAASASIYGARASAGVILITTKKGKYGTGKLNVRYDVSYGLTFPGQGLDLLTPQQQADWTWEALKAANQPLTHPQYGSGATPVLPDYLKAGTKSGVMAGDPALDMSLYNINFDKGPVYQIIRANKQGTDWYDELTEVNPIQNHTLGLSGGSENARYYAGLSYYDEQGVVIGTRLKKYGLRLNSEFKVKDFIRVGQNFQYTYRERPGIDGPAAENDIMFALTINPLIPVYDEAGGFAGTTAAGFNNSTQPVARRIRSKDNKGFSSLIQGNIYAEVDFLRHFTARTSFGGIFNMFQFRFLNYRTYENSENVGNYTFGEGSGNGAGWIWTNTIKYAQEIGKHNINFIGGIEAIADGWFRGIDGNGLNPFSVNLNYLTITNTDPSGRQVNSSGSPLTKLYSQFGKVDYSFDDRFLFSGTVRRDGASVFGEEDKYGVFPAVSAGWRITQEEFMRSTAWLTELKIRGGWGKMGNSRISSANGVNSAGAQAIFGYDLGGGNTSTSPGIALTGIGNPLAKWESNTTINVGFDGTLFNGRLDVIFDWYTRKTEDLLFRQEIAATIGGTAMAPFVNIGSMENKGVDLMLTYKSRAGNDFRFETDLIFTTYRNRITRVSDIANNFDVNFTGRIGGGFVRNEVGQPVSSFFGYQVIGLFQDADEVSKAPTQTDAAPGRFRYADIDNNGVINDNDRTFIGNPNSDFNYGLNLRFYYKNLDFEALFYGTQGGEALNMTKWFTDFYPSFAGIGKSARVLDSWTPTNTDATLPRFENASNFSTNAVLNSYYVEDASYVRLRSVKLGYNLPTRILDRVQISSLRLFLQTTNLFTITDYSGTDPEVSGVDTNFGIDFGNYPANRQFIVGLSLGL